MVTFKDQQSTAKRKTEASPVQRAKAFMPRKTCTHKKIGTTHVVKPKNMHREIKRGVEDLMCSQGV
jgi:hypothetical protein